MQSTGEQHSSSVQTADPIWIPSCGLCSNNHNLTSVDRHRHILELSNLAWASPHLTWACPHWTWACPELDPEGSGDAGHGSLHPHSWSLALTSSFAGSKLCYSLEAAATELPIAALAHLLAACLGQLTERGHWRELYWRRGERHQLGAALTEGSLAAPP